MKKNPSFLMKRSSSMEIQTTPPSWPQPLNKSASMEIPTSSSPPQPPPLPPKKSASFEFPTFLQLIRIPYISTATYHPLAKVILLDLFTCGGCKEVGAGKKFVCSQCNYHLHEYCALAPPMLKNHPFHLQHTLLFYSKPGKGGIMKSKCDICAKSTKGYSLRCITCPFQMQPCCAILSSELNFPATHPHTLKLLPLAAAPSSNTKANFTCKECNRKRSGMIYGCTICDYHLHAVCAKTMVNGLRTNGFKDPGGKSMFGTAARLASLVVVEFIGALIEGLGEGIREVLVQNVLRGRGTRRRNTNRIQ